MKKNRTYELSKRLLFTFIMLFIYVVGRNIILYGINEGAYSIKELNQENLLNSVLTGDRNQYTIFALGIMPYITVSIIVQIVLAILGKDVRNHISKIKLDNITLFATLIFIIALALTKVNSLVFRQDLGVDLLTLKKLSCIEMIFGAMIIYFMAKSNAEYGIGGQTPFIIINIITSLINTKVSYKDDMFLAIAIVSMLIIALTIFMEKKTIKIPVQRVSIHNEYAKNSFIEYKLNPTGMMPVMLAVSFFAIPQVIIKLLVYVFKDSVVLNNINNNFSLNTSFGIIVYLAIVFIITFVFAFVMLSPNDMSDMLQRSGDSIVGVYAGDKTRKYIRNKLLILCFISGIVLCLIMGTSLFASTKGIVSSELALFPSTLMMFVGNIISIITEIKTYYKYDSYKFFV